jgi:hypothetical protein
MKKKLEHVLQVFGCHDTDNTGLTQNMCPEVVILLLFLLFSFIDVDSVYMTCEFQ